MMLKISLVFVFCIIGSVAAQFWTPDPTYRWCRAYGDPHYFKYDGGVTHFQGKCRYLLTGTCQCTKFGDDYIFHVYVENRPWYPGSAATVTRLVDIDIYGYRFRFEEPFQFKVWDDTGTLVSTTIGYSVGTVSTSLLGWWCMQLYDSATGLFVRYCPAFNAAYVRTPCKYRNDTCGICGNYNGDPSDELLVPPETWQVAPTPGSTLPASCYTPPSKRRRRQIEDKLVPFNPDTVPSDHICHLVRRHGCREMQREMFESCVYDVQQAPNDPGAHCLIMEAFANECEFDRYWRKDANCPCPNGKFEEPCGPCPDGSQSIPCKLPCTGKDCQDTVPADQICKLVREYGCEEMQEEMFKRCLQHVQEAPDDPRAHCLVLEAFANQCEFGPEWREKANCPCPDGSYSVPCKRSG